MFNFIGPYSLGPCLKWPLTNKVTNLGLSFLLFKVGWDDVKLYLNISFFSLKNCFLGGVKCFLGGFFFLLHPFFRSAYKNVWRQRLLLLFKKVFSWATCGKGEVWLLLRGGDGPKKSKIC
jgi:hypothetical protein